MTSSIPSSPTSSGIARQVQTAVALATEALLEGDAEVAEQVITDDAEIDRARERVEELVLQPALPAAARGR